MMAFDTVLTLLEEHCQLQWLIDKQLSQITWIERNYCSGALAITL